MISVAVMAPVSPAAGKFKIFGCRTTFLLFNPGDAPVEVNSSVVACLFDTRFPRDRHYFCTQRGNKRQHVLGTVRTSGLKMSIII